MPQYDRLRVLRSLMKTKGLPCCLPMAPFTDYHGCGQWPLPSQHYLQAFLPFTQKSSHAPSDKWQRHRQQSRGFFLRHARPFLGLTRNPCSADRGQCTWWDHCPAWHTLTRRNWMQPSKYATPNPLPQPNVCPHPSFSRSRLHSPAALTLNLLLAQGQIRGRI